MCDAADDLELGGGGNGARGVEVTTVTTVALPCGPTPALSPSVVSSVPAGLSDAEAAARLVIHGPNELPGDAPPTLLRTVLGAFKEPMFLLLAICSSLYFILGDYDEALMLFSFVAFIVVITVIQERRTEKALASLRSLAPAQATVLRGGRELHIPARLLVPGDVCCIQEGDSVPADMALAWASGLLIDEALLTGESAPVSKCPAADAASSSAVQAPNSVQGARHAAFSGTQVCSGKGVGVVKATGSLALIGIIGKSLGEITDDKTPLEKEVRSLVLKMAVIAGAACLVVFLGYGFSRGNWLGATLSGLSLAMGLLPEEFPVVLSVFVTLGALRMSWQRVLVRRNSTVEALSACSVLCTDKTGTLTTNSMTVAAIVTRDGDVAMLPTDSVVTCLPAGIQSGTGSATSEVIELAAMAGQQSRDPMHAAVLSLLRSCGLSDVATRERWELIREYPFSRDTRTTTCVWDSHSNPHSLDIACKGSPEAILRECNGHFSQPEIAAKIAAAAASLADHGLRVVAVARGIYPRLAPLPERHCDGAFDLRFVGIVAFLNPLRPGAKEVVATLQRAGIRVVMCTGDSAGTARCIAEHAGIVGESSFGSQAGQIVVTGTEIDAMDRNALRLRASSAAVFCRVLPQHKLSIVGAFKEAGEVVCMVGDGVNDAPALKAANVGVAMGQRGTQVAREAAALVLLDDELSSLANAVRMGRRIRDNMRKAMSYIISIHVPLCGMVLIPVLLGWPTVFHPAHIVCMELIIDPTSSIVLEAEPEEPDVMERPPTSPSTRLVTANSLMWSLLQGFVVLVVALLLHDACTTHGGFSTEQATTMAFICVVVASLSLVIINRSPRELFLQSWRRVNTAFFVMLAVVASLLCLAIAVPRVRTMLHFGEVSLHHAFSAVIAGVLSVVWYDARKFLHNRALSLLHRQTFDADAAHIAAKSEWENVQLSLLEEGRRRPTFSTAH